MIKKINNVLTYLPTDYCKELLVADITQLAWVVVVEHRGEIFC